jgi:hypothetical protein
MLDENPNEGSNSPLRVISKIEWLEWKKKFKELSKLVTKGFTSSSSQQIDLNSTQLANGSLLKFKFTDRLSDKTNVVCKRDIKIAIMHYTTPAYVDLIPNALNGVVRFFNSGQRTDFLQNLQAVKQLHIKGRDLEFELMNDQEEIEYFSKVNRKRLKLKSRIADKAQKKLDKAKAAEEAHAAKMAEEKSRSNRPKKRAKAK